MASSVIVKIKFEDDLRRLTIPSTTKFEELSKLLSTLFPSLPASFSVKYLDEEGDLISLTSDMELTEAISFAASQPSRLLRLTLISNIKKAESSQTTSTPTSSASTSTPKVTSSSASTSTGASAAAPSGVAAILSHPLLAPLLSQIGEAVTSAPEKVNEELPNLINQIHHVHRQSRRQFRQFVNQLSSNKFAQDNFGPLLSQLSASLDQAPEQLQAELTKLVEQLKGLPESAQQQFKSLIDSINQLMNNTAQPAPQNPFLNIFSNVVKTFAPPHRPRNTASASASASASSSACASSSASASSSSSSSPDTSIPSSIPAYRPPHLRCPFGPYGGNGPRGRYFARFVADITVPDGTEVIVGNSFVKTWRLRNTGETKWPENVRLVFVGGDNLAESSFVPTTPLNPGEEVEISVNMKAPISPGRYVSYWRLAFGEHTPMRFGHRVWADILAIPETKEVLMMEKLEEESAEKVIEEIIPPLKESLKEEVAEIKEEIKEESLYPSIPLPLEEKIEVVEKVEAVASPFYEVVVPVVPHKFENELNQLQEMGFFSRDLNILLLEKHHGDVFAAVNELLI